MASSFSTCATQPGSAAHTSRASYAPLSSPQRPWVMVAMCLSPSEIRTSPSRVVAVNSPHASAPAVSSTHTNSTLSTVSRTGCHVSGPPSGSASRAVLDPRCGASARHRLLRHPTGIDGHWPRARMSAIGAVRRLAWSVLSARLTRPCARMVWSQAVSGAVLMTLSHPWSVKSAATLTSGRSRSASTSCSSA